MLKLHLVMTSQLPKTINNHTHMVDCIFCSIVNHTQPAKIFFEDEKIVVFETIAPKTKIHWLIVPRLHIASLNEALPEHGEVFGHLIAQVPRLARQAGIAESGYKLVANTGKDGGQMVYHIHFHLLGGEPLNGLV